MARGLSQGGGWTNAASWRKSRGGGGERRENGSGDASTRRGASTEAIRPSGGGRALASRRSDGRRDERQAEADAVSVKAGACHLRSCRRQTGAAEEEGREELMDGKPYRGVGGGPETHLDAALLAKDYMGERAGWLT